jgi:hypothetical protein
MHQIQLVLENFSIFLYIAGQQNVEDSNRIVWCTINSEEQRKCLNFAQAVERDWNLFGSAAMRLECKQVCTNHNIVPE